MTSRDAERRVAKKKGGKDGYITGEVGRKNWDNAVVEVVQQKLNDIPQNQPGWLYTSAFD